MYSDLSVKAVKRLMSLALLQHFHLEMSGVKVEHFALLKVIDSNTV